jgi:hypothetical protein
MLDAADEDITFLRRVYKFKEATRLTSQKAWNFLLEYSLIFFYILTECIKIPLHIKTALHRTLNDWKFSLIFLFVRFIHMWNFLSICNRILCQTGDEVTHGHKMDEISCARARTRTHEVRLNRSTPMQEKLPIIPGDPKNWRTSKS